jgi:hypothetical protein
VNSSRSRGEVLGELSSIRKSSFHRAAYPTKCCKNGDFGNFASPGHSELELYVKRAFRAGTVLVRGLGTVCPVTLSRVYMQTCTILHANVNRVETWAVRLWREAKNVAIRDLIRERDQSTLQTAPVFKLEVFAAC